MMGHICIIFIIRVKINFPLFTSRSTYNRVFKTTKVNVPINSIFEIGKSITIEPAVNYQIFTRGFVIFPAFFVTFSRAVIGTITGRTF